MGGCGDQLALCTERKRDVPKVMSEATFEFKTNANIVSQLPRNGFDLLIFTTEMTTMGRSF